MCKSGTAAGTTAGTQAGMSTTTVTAQVAVPPVHVLSSALAPPTKLKTGVKGTLRPGLLTKEDLWSVHGKYYDLNTFVARHPGGVDAILLGKGLDDCTSLFESYHPFTTKPEKVLRQFLYTRALAPSLEKHADTPYMQNRKDLARAEHTVMQQPVVDTIDPFFDWAKTPFYDDCKRVALTHFSPRGNESVEQVHLNIKATTRAWVQHTIGFGVLCWAFVQFLSGSIPALTYFPLVYWIVASDLMHNGSHFAMSPNPVRCYNSISSVEWFTHLRVCVFADNQQNLSIHWLSACSVSSVGCATRHRAPCSHQHHSHGSRYPPLRNGPQTRVQNARLPYAPLSRCAAQVLLELAFRDADAGMGDNICDLICQRTQVPGGAGDGDMQNPCGMVAKDS